MSVSARNIFKGKVTAIKGGPINAEIEITTAGGDTIVAMLTEASVQSLALALGCEAVAELGLSEGAAVVALFKASHVLVGVPA